MWLIDILAVGNLTKMIICDTSSKMCMNDEECKDKTVQRSSFDGLAKVKITQWARAEKKKGRYDGRALPLSRLQ